jgi:tetratricopeptide (TPR) repeat protein
MKISVAICIYNDFDFIEECIGRVYDLADEIVILDGPYGYCEPMLKYFDLYYSDPPDALRKISGLRKVRYEFGMFENEKSKRVALYQMCNSDVVMLLDSDELIVDIHRDELERFFQSDKKVACSSFNNLVRSNCLSEKPTRKFIFFKRQDISAEEHLNYTWLVGVDQVEPNREFMYLPPVTEMAHLTLMRSPYFNMVKYCFYSRLYYYSRGMHDQLNKLFGRPFEALSNKGLSPNEIKEIFRRSYSALINFSVETPLFKIALPTIDSRFDEVAEITFLTENQRVRVLNSVESYHYMDIPKHLLAGDEVHFSFLTRDIEMIEVEIIVHNYATCTKLAIELDITRAGEVHGSYVLPHDSAGLFGTLIKFKAECDEPDGVGTVTQFVIKRRFGIYGNCQTESLRDFLLASRSFCQRYLFEETPGRLVHMMNDQDVKAFHKKIYRIDHLITQPIGDTFAGNPEFGSNAIFQSLRPDAKVFMLPNLFFTGYAPDSYCVTFRKKFLQKPMPVHDVNFMYSYLKYGGKRDFVRADYEKKLAGLDFYSAKFIHSHVEKNISELAARESEAREKFKNRNVHVYSYSKFVAHWYDKTLVHYSDAHPTEFVFSKLAQEILEDLGLENDVQPTTLGEKGVVPFYKSIDSALGLDACSTPIYLGNRDVSFDEYFRRYCDAYDEIEKRELFGYISRNVTKVVVTNHKTGTLLMQSILGEYCSRYRLRLLDLNHYLLANRNEVDPTFDFQQYDFIFATHAQHFEKLVNAVPNLRYRAIHLIRNPYEIIMSGVRYHQITDEEWCNKRIFVADKYGRCGFRRIAAYNVDASGQVGDYSYRDIMNSLPADEKVEFEIRNHASTFGTIGSIARFLKRFRRDGNVATVRLEGIATDKCINDVFEFLALNEDFLEHYRSKVGARTWLGRHVTNADGKDTYKSSFNDKLYHVFAAASGFSVLHDFGYALDSALQEYFTVAEEPSESDPVPVEADGSTKSADDVPIIPAQGSADELYAVGEKLFALGKLDLAREAFERELALDDSRVSTLGRLGDICVRLREYEDALVYFQRIGSLMEVTPAWVDIGLANAYRALKQKNVDEVCAVGEKLLALSKLDLARQEFERALALDDSRISTLGRLGDICMRLKQPEEALVFYERVDTLSEVKPAWVDISLANAYRALKQKNVDEVCAVGEKLLELGKLDLARQEFERALALDDSRVSTLGRLGDICMRLKQPEEALVFYERVDTLSEVTPAWVDIGLANANRALKQKNVDEACAVGEKLLALGKLDLAREAFERALALDDSGVSTLGRLGDICVRLGDYEDAVVYFQRIGQLIEVTPVWVYIGLANAYQALKQQEPAIMNLRLALPLMQDSEALQSRLEALEAACAQEG